MTKNENNKLERSFYPIYQNIEQFTVSLLLILQNGTKQQFVDAYSGRTPIGKTKEAPSAEEQRALSTVVRAAARTDESGRHRLGSI
jgi:hypothetical protein